MYGSLEGWRSYALARGNSAPTDAPDDLAMAALVRGSDYIEYHYVANFATDPTESLLEAATYEAAQLELDTPNLFTSVYTPDQQKVLTGVDSLRWTVVEAKGMSDRDAAMPVSSRIESMLKPYLSRDNAVGLMSIGGPSCG